MQRAEHKCIAWLDSFQKLSQGRVISEASLASLPMTKYTILISFLHVTEFLDIRAFFPIFLFPLSAGLMLMLASVGLPAT